jgi:chemosensory pili system protein ChpA (sensor histidine kinase/response regulator)
MTMQEAHATGQVQTNNTLPAMNTLPFDLGPLSWVADEIHVSLMRAHDGLQEAMTLPDTAVENAVMRSQACLHQAHGALCMLEIDGVDLLSAGLEKLLGKVMDGQHSLDAGLVYLFGQTCQALQEYLDELQEGAGQQPLRLFPYYQDLLKASGIDQVHAINLFYAGFRLQLAPVPAAVADTAPPPPREPNADRVSTLLALRQRFEKALLQYLKHPAEVHAFHMRDVIAAVKQQQDGQPHHAFWWVMHGFADAVATRQLGNDVSTKHLFGRINMQLQRLSKDTFCGNDSVLNEALFQVARIPMPGPSQRAIRDIYRLDGLVPVNFEQKRYCLIDLEALRFSNAQIVRVKNLWSRIVQGESNLGNVFAQDMQQLSAACLKFNSVPLSNLIEQLNLSAYKVIGGERNEALCLEIATGLLVLESGLNNIHHLSGHFTLRTDAMIERLQKIDAGAASSSALVVMEAEFSQVQQQTMHVLVEEMQSGLREVENLLDAFFRQESHAATLTKLVPRLHQIEGALAMLEQDAAVRAIQQTQLVVGDFAQGLIAPDEDAFNRLAQNVGALGLFMDALQCNADDAKRQFVFEGDTCLFRVHGGEMSLTGASLLADTTVATATACVPISAESALLVSTLSTQLTQKFDPASAEDVELRLIFLSEAREVLSLVSDAMCAMQAQSDSVESMTSLRRFFHTLKGSARMVAFHDFSTSAGEIEKLLDTRLAEKMPADSAFLNLVQSAYEKFSHWLDALERQENSTFIADTCNPAPEQRADPSPSAEPPGSAFDAGIKQIGSLRISLPLYIIFRTETEDLIRSLSHEVAAWRHAPGGAVSIKAVHAAHSLAGSSATVGLKPVHEIAFAIEAILQHQIRKPVRMAAYEFDMLTRAVDSISHMLSECSASQMPASNPAMVQILLGVLDDIDSRSDAWIEHSAKMARDSSDVIVGDDAGANLPALPPSMPQVLPADVFLAAHFDSGAYVNDAIAVQDAPDVELLPVFLEEAHDAMPLLGQTLREWRRKPDDTALAQALLRMAHTLKGSARMGGAMRLGQHLHQLEARIESCMHSQPVAIQVFDDLMLEHDRILHLYEQLCDPARRDDSDSDGRQGFAAGITSDTVRPLGVALTSTLVRVRTELLDRLVNEAGEVSISRSKLETDVGSLRQSLADLDENVVRLREQLREIEMQAESQINSQISPVVERVFDALEFDRFTRLQELTRMMAESVDDVVTVQQSLSNSLNSASNGLAAQGRLTRALQKDLLQVRMVQFGSIADRLYRVVRQTAKELGKRVNLDIRGSGLEVDRSVLDRMAGPFEHLLRNAIVHGIEQESLRRAAGKSPNGELRIDVRQEGNEVILQFADDGAGLDMAAIRARALAIGMLPDATDVADDELIELIFNPGFSTAASVTQAAGRGIGMDAVRSAAAGLGGTLMINSRSGQGMCVTIRLPLTLAVTQVVLVKLGMRTYALPSILVEQVIKLKPDAYANACSASAVDWQGDSIAMHDLNCLLGEPAVQLPGKSQPGRESDTLSQQYAPILILRNARQRLAVHVDDIVGNREVVVKNTGPQLARVPGIAGATVLGSGEIVLIINPLQLAQHIHTQGTGAAIDETPPAVAKPVVVMVVDDSLTVRRVTQRFLVREGYQVVLAKDGVEALERLQAMVPDVMLVDVEMPRMDGFDLSRNVRSDVRTHAVPIIMITSRTAAKHRDFALGLGVNAYFGKPFQEADLLKAITRVLAATETDAGDGVTDPAQRADD